MHTAPDVLRRLVAVSLVRPGPATQFPVYSEVTDHVFSWCTNHRLSTSGTGEIRHGSDCTSNSRARLSRRYRPLESRLMELALVVLAAFGIRLGLPLGS